jgi:hypothetical protein
MTFRAKLVTHPLHFANSGEEGLESSLVQSITVTVSTHKSAGDQGLQIKKNMLLAG